MADTRDDPSDDIPSGSEMRRLLGDYEEFINDHTEYARIVKGMSELSAVIEALNRGLDRETSAFYAEYLKGTLYRVETDGEFWRPLSNLLVQGSPRPFIGDRLHLTSDGVLLLVDTARQTGVAGFVHLQVRSKEDAAVGEFSGDESIGMVQKLGELARQREDGAPSVISRNRWGQETTDPSIDSP